ncbi:MAG: FixH family protein [Burkholderiales bacterium]
MMIRNAPHSKPWYREPWPWLLMAGPALVIVAGVYTTWLAIQSDDGLVSDDYYKQGLAINRTIKRNEVATNGQYHARISFDQNTNFVRADVSAIAGLPPELKVTLVNATRATRDRTLLLRRSGDGVYIGELPAIQPGRWRVSLEDLAGSWRLSGEWPASTKGSFDLDAGTS